MKKFELLKDFTYRDGTLLKAGTIFHGPDAKWKDFAYMINLRRFYYAEEEMQKFVEDGTFKRI